MDFTDWRACEGQRIEGKYYLQTLSGAGSFGGVFLADEVVADRLIRQTAVKLIEPDSADPNGQMQELIAAANLDHPGLLRCFTFGECVLHAKRLLYLVMELADQTLEKRLEAGTLSAEEAYDVGRRLASALAYLHGHANPLVHRDVKTANVMRAGGVWKLGDFGLLRALHSAQAERTGRAVGTAAYAPPESFAGELSPAWDVWSLGVVLLEALTGRLPYAAETPHHLMIAISSRAPEIPPDLPVPFDAVIPGCLTRDPLARWTARQVEEALSAASGFSPFSISQDVAPAHAAYLDALRIDAPSITEGPVVLRVGAVGKSDFLTISEAIRCAGPNAIIRVQPGVYSEEIVLNKPLEIVTEGEAGSVFIENHDAPCVVMQTETAALRGLILHSRAGVRGRKHPAVDIGQGQLTLEDCEITCTSLSCVAVRGAETQPILRRCRLHDGKTGGVLVTEGAKPRLEECEIFHCSGPGVEIRQAGDPTLTRCQIYGGRQAGVLVAERGRGTLETCDIVSNAGPGVEVGEGGHPTLRGCKLYDGEQTGLSFKRLASGTIEDCDIFGNVLSGVTIAQGASPTLTLCRIRDGQSNGVWVTDGGQGVLADCDIHGNAFAGVKIGPMGSPVLQRCAIHKGKRGGVVVQERGRGALTDCEIAENAQAGVLVEAGGNLLMRGCVLRDGREAGLWLAGSATLENCDIFGNVKAGIEVAQGGEPIARSCKIHHGRYPGVLVQGGGRGAFEDCDLFACDFPNIAIGEQSFPVFRKCRIFDGRQVGVTCWAKGGGLLEDCEIHGNLLGGVRIAQGSDPILRRCRITRNGHYGVWVTENGAGCLEACDLTENERGAWLIEAGSAPRGADNITG